MKADKPAVTAAVTPAVTPASIGHDASVDVDVIARAERTRARDRRVLRICVRALKVLGMMVLIGAPAWAVLTPNAYPSLCRSKQSEAKGNLKALYVASEAYRAEFDRYVVDQDALGWTARGARIRYDYFIKTASPESFEAYAVGADAQVAGDVWRITEENNLINVVNGCR